MAFSVFCLDKYMYKMAYYGKKTGKHQNAIRGDGDAKSAFTREQREAPQRFWPLMPLSSYSYSPAGPGDSSRVQSHHHLTHPSDAQIRFALRKRFRALEGTLLINSNVHQL